MSFILSASVIFACLTCVAIALYLTTPTDRRTQAVLFINLAFLVGVFLAALLHASIVVMLILAAVWLVGLQLARRLHEKHLRRKAQAPEQAQGTHKSRSRFFGGRRTSFWITATIYVSAVFAGIGLIQHLPQSTIQTLTETFWLLMVVTVTGWTISGAFFLTYREGIRAPANFARTAIIISAILTFIVCGSAWPIAVGNHLDKSPLAALSILMMFVPRLLLEARDSGSTPVKPLNYLNYLVSTLATNSRAKQRLVHKQH